MQQHFNVFQQIMRLWDRVHPYNAGQVLHLEGRADVSQWTAAWATTAARLRIGRIRFGANHYSHEPVADAVKQVQISNERFEDVASRQLNRLFDADDEQPFFPFVIAGEIDSFIGLMYRHWVADSAAVRMLLREWFLNAHHPAQARTTPLDIPAGGFWHYFGPESARWDMHEGIGALARLRTRFGRARLIDEPPNRPHQVAFSLHTLPDGTAQRLLDLARARGIKLTDIFLAAAAEACDRHGVNPRVPGREDLALGTIVDMRPMSRRPLASVMGMFLGFTTTVIRGSDLARWPRLLQSIAAQNELHRRTQAAPASVLRMAAALFEQKFFSPADWCARYRRQMPMAAGLSNVNLTDSWAARYHPAPIRDYIRISPTGPLLPIVFTPTTLGRKLHIGLTRQTSLIDQASAGKIISTVIDRICRVVSEGLD